jgi:cytoskeletal protein CcmA (bactofilin family)
MRLHAITGSLADIDAVASSKASPAAIAASDLEGVLGQFAGAIKRIHGDAAFTNQDAGKFVHETAQFIGVLSASSDLKAGGALDIAGMSDLHGAVHAYDTLEVDALATLDSVVVEDLAVAGGLVFNNASGRLKNDAKLYWDEATSTLTVDGALSVSAGIDLGELGAQQVVFTDENGNLKTDAGFTFVSSSMTLEVDGYLNVGNDLDVNGAADIFGAVNLQSTLAVAGAADLNGALDVSGSSDLHGAVKAYGTLEVDGQATLASVNVEDLTAGRVVYAGANGELVDSAKLTFASDELAIDGTLDVTGAADVGGDFKVATNKFIVESSTGNVTAAGDLIAVDGTFSGDVSVAGNLVVSGDQIIANVTTVVVEDKNIELGAISGSAPSDATADGGGITLKGSTDHTINWSNTADAWVFSENLHPSADAAKDLGSASAQWKDLYLSADAMVGGDLDVNGAADIQGALNLQAGITVGGIAAFNGLVDVNAGMSASLIKIDSDVATRLYIVDADGSIKDEAKLTFDGSELLVSADLEVSGAADLKSTLAVAGAADLNGSLDVALASDLHGAVYAYSTLRADGVVDFNDAMDVAGASDLHGVVHAYDALRVDGAADFKSSMLVTGSVQMLNSLDVGGIATFTGIVNIDGTPIVSANMTLDAAGLQTITKSVDDLALKVTAGQLFVSASSHLSMSAGASMMFADGFKGASSWPTAGIPLAKSADEWTQLSTAFGGAEVSIIGALVAGGAGGKYKKEVSTTIASGSAITASDFAHFDGESAHFGTKWTQLVGSTLAKKMAKVDVYVNGQLMLGGSGMDYDIASASGNITFAFPLVADDVIVLVVR